MAVRPATNLLVVHCAATKARMDIGAAEIRRWHKEKGWADIGYHYVIRRNGVLEVGRDESTVGAHAVGHNARSIGICLVGGIDEQGHAENNFTPAQFAALRRLLVRLAARYPAARIVGHRDLNPGKDCPSFDIADWLRGTGLSA